LEDSARIKQKIKIAQTVQKYPKIITRTNSKEQLLL